MAMTTFSVEGTERDEDWTERFIQIIHGKPAIYNTHLKEHCDRNYVTRLWNEVSEAIVPTWHEMMPQERALKAKELQQRWRNLRTCFRRELNKQRSSQQGLSTKRRKYIYYDKLLFLLPTIEDRDTVSECSPPHTEEENSENDGCLLGDDHDKITLHTHYGLPMHTKEEPLYEGETSYETPQPKVAEEHRYDELDEDKLFLLSLIPSFRKMSMAQKIEAKIEFLSVIRRVFHTHPS